MLLGPKNFRPGQRDDNARIQKLERQVAQLSARLDALSIVTPSVPDNGEPVPIKRGPGRPRKEQAAA